MVCMVSPMLSVQLVLCPTGLTTALTMVRDVVLKNGVQTGVENDDIAVAAIEKVIVIVTGDIGAVVVIVNHVKKKDIVVVTVGTVVVEVLVDIVAVVVAVRVVISHNAVHTKTGDSTVRVVVLIRGVDQGRMEMTVGPSATTGLMGKKQTMNAGPGGMERTLVQRTRETGIAMKEGHLTMSMSVTSITARPRQIPRVLVIQLSVFAVGVAGKWRLNVQHRVGTRVSMPERVVFRMRVLVSSVKPQPRQCYLRILSPSNLYPRVWAGSHTPGVPGQTSTFGGSSYLPFSILRTRELR